MMPYATAGTMCDEARSCRGRGTPVVQASWDLSDLEVVFSRLFGVEPNAAGLGRP